MSHSRSRYHNQSYEWSLVSGHTGRMRGFSESTCSSLLSISDSEVSIRTGSTVLGPSMAGRPLPQVPPDEEISQTVPQSAQNPTGRVSRLKNTKQPGRSTTGISKKRGRHHSQRKTTTKKTLKRRTLVIFCVGSFTLCLLETTLLVVAFFKHGTLPWNDFLESEVARVASLACVNVLSRLGSTEKGGPFRYLDKGGAMHEGGVVDKGENINKGRTMDKRGAIDKGRDMDDRLAKNKGECCTRSFTLIAPLVDLLENEEETTASSHCSTRIKMNNKPVQANLQIQGFVYIPSEVQLSIPLLGRHTNVVKRVATGVNIEANSLVIVYSGWYLVYVTISSHSDINQPCDGSQVTNLMILKHGGDRRPETEVCLSRSNHSSRGHCPNSDIIETTLTSNTGGIFHMSEGESISVKISGNTQFTLDSSLGVYLLAASR